MEGERASVLPYVRLEPWENVSVWGMAGSGTGTLSTTLCGPERADERHRADIAMTVAAAGAHARLLEPGLEGSLALAMKGEEGSAEPGDTDRTSGPQLACSRPAAIGADCRQSPEAQGLSASGRPPTRPSRMPVA